MADGAALLRTIADTTLDAFITIDAAGIVIAWNTHAEHIFGWTAAEAIGQALSGLIVPPQHRLAHQQGMQRYLDGHPGPLLHRRIEITAMHKRGQEFDVELAITPLRLGEPVHFAAFLRDISERKRADAALRESEERFRDISNASGGYTFELDANNQYTFVSENAQAVTGYLPDELLGRMPAAFMPEGELARVNRWLEHNPMPDGSIRGLEHRIVDKSGDIRWIQIFKAPVHDSAGRVTGHRGSVTNITAQHESDRIRQMMQFSVEHASDAVFWLAPDGQILYTNEAASLNLGYSSGEFLRMTVFDFEVGLPRDVWPLHWAELKQRGSVAIEGRHRAKDGRLIDVDVSASFANIEGQEFNFAFARNITARKQIEMALQESEARFRAVAEWMPVPMHLIRDGRLLYVNRAAASNLGADLPDSLIGKSALDIVAAPFHAMIKTRLEHVRLVGETNPLAHLQFLRLDGTAIDVEGNSVAIAFQGAPATCVVWQDVSLRKRAEAARASLEAQLRESQKMQAIGTLAGGIAHDFNNIVATILGNADLARQDAGANGAVLTSLDEILKAAARGRDLVQQILSFSRREPTRRLPIDLKAVVVESARLLRATLPARLALTVMCDDTVPPVLADATQLQQVLLNLATNAMQAMRGETGHITLGLDTVILDHALAMAHPELLPLFHRQPGRVAHLSVADDGAGMSQETLARIFEPFFTTKPVGEGTGLGLSVAHGIVEAHEGTILVDSTPGRGTTFHIYFSPVVNPDQSRAASERGAGTSASDPAPAAATGKHILYLDDDAGLLFLVKRMLQRHGHRVSTFAHQAEALDTLRQNPNLFDLVLSDYNMPGKSGLDVALEVRLLRPDLPVAIASGFIDETLRAQASGAGVRQVIFKAVDAQEFCTAIQGLLVNQ